VQGALTDAGLDVMLDDALLLVTELVTNAVVHAGTDIELHVEVGVDSARVEVIDHSAGSLPVLHGDPDSSREGGRGIFLLDALAREWGTRHFAGGKSVWFALGVVDRAAPRPMPLRRAAAAHSPAPPAVGWLLGLPADLEERLSTGELVGELLHRLCVAMDLPGGWLLTESSADGEVWGVVAAHDASAPEPDVELVRRQARAGHDRLLVEGGGEGGGDALLLPLRRRTGVFGALVLVGGGQLDEGSVALARLVGDRMGVVLRDDRAHAAQLRDRGSLALLAEASEMFAGTLDVTLAVTLATQLVVPRFATWSAVYVVEEDGPRLASLAHEDEGKVGALRQGLHSPSAERLVARLVGELPEQPTLLQPAQLAALATVDRSEAVIAVLLVARRRPLGVLLAGRTAAARYARDDAGLLLDLARRAALAIDNARLYSERTHIAQVLQASLLPPDLPAATGIAFGARYAAAGSGNEVGGDFYDVFALRDGRWGVAIGDVCGKGAEAAAITGLARNVLRLLVREGQPAPAALRQLNEAILELGERGRFCTASLATLERRPDGAVVRLSSAGHPPPVLITADGAARFVGRSGDLLGVLEEVDVADDEVHLGPGDNLVFYTDGVTERRNGDAMFGEFNLLAACRSAAGGTADAVAGRLDQAVRDFSVDASRDDLAVLVVQVPADEP
jgi:serine phosphatase RsbU (regulator of sigma subunit)